MYNFDPYNVFLAIASNIPQRLNTAFVLQGHIWFKHLILSLFIDWYSVKQWKGQLADHCGPFYGTASSCGLSETDWTSLPHVFWTDHMWSDHVTRTSETRRPWEVLLNGMEDRTGWALQILTLFVIFHRWRAFRGHFLDLSSAVLSGLHGTELMLLLIDPRKWETAIILRLSRGCHSNYRRQTQWGTAIYSRLRKAEFIKWAATQRQIQSVLLTWSTFIVGITRGTVFICPMTMKITCITINELLIFSIQFF